MENVEVTNKQKLYFIALSKLARIVQRFRNGYWRLKGYDIHPSTVLERNINLDKIYPSGIHIGRNCLIGAGVMILSHDHCRRGGKI